MYKETPEVRFPNNKSSNDFRRRNARSKSIKMVQIKFFFFQSVQRSLINNRYCIVELFKFNSRKYMKKQ